MNYPLANTTSSVPFEGIQNTSPAGYFDRCIHELIEERVEIQPDAVAIRSADFHLSYRALNSRANQIARYLRDQHVCAEQVVGIFTEPSTETAIAAIATLKAGGAYLGLATTQPRLRLMEIIKESGSRALITATGPDPDLDGVKTICLKRDADEIAKQSCENLPGGVELDNLAFVRYTSGSTGKPKGVLNTHRSLVSRLISQPLADVQGSDICAINTSLGFGARLFYPLACGGTVVVMPDEATRDARRLAERIDGDRITSIYMVPSLLRELLQLDAPLVRRLQVLRAVTVGGEAVNVQTVERFLRALPSTILINTYGSNEIGTTAAMRVIQNGAAATSRLGPPAPNTRLYVLDNLLNVTPIGTTGEIFVSSAHLARGYLDRPEITAESFLPDPFEGCGTRLYRTGDLGRYHKDGSIEFLGRSDSQVKVRGFRVELGEIEARLGEVPGVAETVAATYLAGDDTRLAAYVVAEADTILSVRPLRDHLRQHLPDYMVPAIFMFIDRVPRTARGKIDRSALPRPNPARPDLDSEFAQPRDPIEFEIGKIWAAALGMETVGIHDDFLQLGGDSLVAARVVAAIAAQYRVEFPAMALLEGATIAQIAAGARSQLSAMDRVDCN